MNSDALRALPIALPNGALVPLGSLAGFTVEAGQPEITRENLQQIVNVTARLTGRGLGAGIADVKAALARPGMLGPGVTYTLGGVYQQQQIAFAGLAHVFAAALLAEFVLLMLLYERFSWVLAIMGTSLLSTTAVFTGLWLTGVPLNITALMGMVMIIGIATEMAIFYVSEFTHLLARMPLREALMTASGNRLRPITMTTLAAIFTLLPLALRSRPRGGDAAAAGDRHHRRAAGAVPAGAARLAGAALSHHRARQTGRGMNPSSAAFHAEFASSFRLSLRTAAQRIVSWTRSPFRVAPASVRRPRAPMHRRIGRFWPATGTPWPARTR